MQTIPEESKGAQLGTVKFWNADQEYAVVAPRTGAGDLIVSKEGLRSPDDGDPTPGSEVVYVEGRSIGVAELTEKSSGSRARAARNKRLEELQNQVKKHKVLLSRIEAKVAHLQSHTGLVEAGELTTATTAPKSGGQAESSGDDEDTIGVLPLPLDNGESGPHTRSLDGVHGRSLHALGALLGFGTFVRMRRKAFGLTLEELAVKAGTSVPQLSQIERGTGKRGPSLDLVARILWALDLRLQFGDAASLPVDED